MRAFPLVAAAVAIAIAGCAPPPVSEQQAEWREVLRHKPAAAADDASPEQKQLYADSVRAFMQRHPTHERAREVWGLLQVEFADDLAEAGRNEEAIRFYRAVLERDPENEHARRGFAAAADRLAITREKLLVLEKGMTRSDVREILGRPLPGWTNSKRRPGATFEAWYYRMRSGTVAAVYFRDGKVFAAEESSNERVARLGS